MARYRRNIKKVYVPKEIRGVYERLRYIEEHYGDLEIEARLSAAKLGVNYYSHQELFNPNYPYPPAVRLRTARRSLRLLTGKYQEKRYREYANQYAQQIMQYDYSLGERVYQIIKSDKRIEFLNEAPDLGIMYTKFTKGKKQSRTRLPRDDVQIEEWLSAVDSLLGKYGF